MHASSRSSRPRRSAFLAGALVLAVGLAACGSSSKSSTAPKPGSTTTPQTVSVTTGPPNTTPEVAGFGQGVTATTVKIGVVFVDYKAIAQFIDFQRGDQQKIFQTFVDDINAHGGVAGGRKLVPYYDTYFPAGSAGPLQACTQFTEDDKVFATIGVLIDASGGGQLCFTKQHHSILLTHELSEDVMSKADPGLLLTTDALAERSARTMLDLAKNKGILAGKKFAILAETGTKSRIASAIEPEMKKLGVPYGTAGVLNIGQDEDTTAGQAQMSPLIERWKGENDNAVFISGLGAVSKVFVQKIRAAMPDVLLMTDTDSSAKGAGQDAVHAGITPNPYDGMLSLTGLSDEQQFETPRVQACVKTYETATGEKVRGAAGSQARQERQTSRGLDLGTRFLCRSRLLQADRGQGRREPEQHELDPRSRRLRCDPAGRKRGRFVGHREVRRRQRLLVGVVRPEHRYGRRLEGVDTAAGRDQARLRCGGRRVRRPLRRRRGLRSCWIVGSRGRRCRGTTTRHGGPTGRRPAGPRQ